MRARAIALLVLAALALAGCTTASTSPEQTLVPASNELVVWFMGQHPECAIEVSALGDVTADGKDDLVVIYRSDDPDKCWMRVVIGGDVPVETDETPAPVENQHISFRDIDDTAPAEFIVRGSKAGDIGYAIYRVEDGGVVDLFGENMDRCC